MSYLDYDQEANASAVNTLPLEEDILTAEHEKSKEIDAERQKKQSEEQS